MLLVGVVAVVVLVFNKEERKVQVWYFCLILTTLQQQSIAYAYC